MSLMNILVTNCDDCGKEIQVHPTNWQPDDKRRCISCQKKREAEQGITQLYHCSKCGRTFSEEQVLRMNGHGVLKGNPYNGFKSKECDGELIKHGAGD